MTIKAIQTTYKGYRFRSRLEARWGVFFDALGIKWEYEKEGIDLGHTLYLPDFWVEPWKAWVEIKPEVFEQQSRGHDLCLSLSEADPQNVALLLSGNPWPTDHSVIVCKGGYTARVGEFVELAPRHQQFYGLAITNPGEESWYPLASYDRPMLDDAFLAARQARFEHGESPAIPMQQNLDLSDERIRACLTRHGFPDAKYSIMCLFGKPHEPSVILLKKENVAFHFSPDDPLYRPDGQGGVRPVKPFDVLATYEFGGDYGKALAALAAQH